jgi:hypothetical protein
MVILNCRSGVLNRCARLAGNPPTPGNRARPRHLWPCRIAVGPRPLQRLMFSIAAVTVESTTQTFAGGPHFNLQSGSTCLDLPTHTSPAIHRGFISNSRQTH